MSDNGNPAAAEVRRLVLEAGRLAESSGMPSQEFAAAMMDALKALMLRQVERAERGLR